MYYNNPYTIDLHRLKSRLRLFQGIKALSQSVRGLLSTDSTRSYGEAGHGAAETPFAWPNWVVYHCGARKPGPFHTGQTSIMQHEELHA